MYKRQSTDWVDGYLARRYDQCSALGALLDPLGDKAMSWSALVVICYHIHEPTLWFASLTIILRDLIITTKRVRAYQHQCSDQYPVSQMAKIKTATLFMAEILLIGALLEQNMLVQQLGLVLLYGSSLLTLISLGSYVKQPRDAER